MQYPNKTTWAEWRDAGNDRHSIQADPMFADSSKNNFHLLPGSPALKIGIPQPNQAVGSRNTPLPARSTKSYSAA